MIFDFKNHYILHKQEILLSSLQLFQIRIQCKTLLELH